MNIFKDLLHSGVPIVARSPLHAKFVVGDFRFVNFLLEINTSNAQNFLVMREIC